MCYTCCYAYVHFSSRYSKFPPKKSIFACRRTDEPQQPSALPRDSRTIRGPPSFNRSSNSDYNRSDRDYNRSDYNRSDYNRSDYNRSDYNRSDRSDYNRPSDNRYDSLRDNRSWIGISVEQLSRGFYRLCYFLKFSIFLTPVPPLPLCVPQRVYR